MTPYEITLKRLMAQDERIVALTAENRAPLRSFTHGLGNRFIDTGITEQTMIGAAAGLALQGRRPVAHALAAFLTMRAFEFIRTDVGLGELPVVLVGFIAGLLSDGNGPTHQALEDVALMRSIPGMQIFCPADRDELAMGLELALKTERPTYIRWMDRPAVFPVSPFHWGKADLLLEGHEVCLLTYGTLATEAWLAAKILEERGVSVRFLNLRTIVPFDEGEVLRAIESTDVAFTIEDHFVTGGLYTQVAEMLLRRRVMADVVPIAFNGKWFKPALYDDVIAFEGLTPEAIANRVLKKLDPRRRDVQTTHD